MTDTMEHEESGKKGYDRSRGLNAATRRACGAWLAKAMADAEMSVDDLARASGLHHRSIDELRLGSRVVGWEITQFLADILKAEIPPEVARAVRFLSSHRTRQVREAMNAFQNGVLPPSTKIEQDPSVVASRIFEDLMLLRDMATEPTVESIVSFLRDNKLTPEEKAEISQAVWS